MRPVRLQVLVTQRCVYRCSHCYVWGCPEQEPAMTIAEMQRVLWDAHALNSVHQVTFDGGEPFLYYPVLLEGLRLARFLGFETRVVTSGDWAVDEASARCWLAPIREAGIGELVVGSTAFHAAMRDPPRGDAAVTVAESLGLRVLRSPAGDKAICFRGRAAVRLVAGRPRLPWRSFTSCTHLDLREPEELIVDPEGMVHLCHGVVLGNLYWQTLAEIAGSYDPDSDPVLRPLAQGGPALLAEEHGIVMEEGAVDACHLCYTTRCRLRARYPDRLGPDSMYGEPAR